TRECYPTKHSHVNIVVIDSGWEGRMAKMLDDLADEGRVISWVKNAFLDFRIPYTNKQGEEKIYYPDFIVRACTGAGEAVNLVLEVTGQKRDKWEKVWATKNRWVPAANCIREQYKWDRWDFIEISEDIRDGRNQLLWRLRDPNESSPLPRGMPPSLAELSPELLRQIVERIVKVANPEKVVLFGSRCRTTHRPDSDFDAAELLVDNATGLEAMCFHCQRAAEKSLKAWLVAHDIQPPKTHWLDELIELCLQREPGFAQFMAAAKALTPYAVKLRY